MTAVETGPNLVSTRGELAAALSTLRSGAGLTVREVVERAGGLHGTIAGWFAGQHVPTKSSRGMFDRVLGACGVTEPSQQEQWWLAVVRVRASMGARAGSAPSPYKGLEAFEFGDSALFFGRSELTQRLVDRVQQTLETASGLIMVIGASGSGKSSLLRAGLAPAIRGAAVSIVNPGSDPVELLAAISAPALASRVLIIDQAEELWTLAPPDERVAFVRALSEIIAADQPRTAVVFGLRADFFEAVMGVDLLLPALSDNPIVVGRLSADELRDVIVEPARIAGMTVDEPLLRALTTELEPTGSAFAHDVGALPLLSHALLDTWQRSTGKVLTAEDYFATGGISGAVQQTAEEVFSALTEAQQNEARRIFLRLVNVDDDTVTRRRIDRVQLFRTNDIDDVNAVIEAFARRRLVTVDEESVQVTHEALLGAWARLGEWLAADREWIVNHRRLMLAASTWDESARDPGALLTGARLALTLDYVATDARDADLNSVERDFLSASTSHRDAQAATERRRRRVVEVLLGALVVVTILAVTLAITAVGARSDAVSRRNDAEAAQRQSVSREIAGKAQQLAVAEPGLAAQFAVAAFDVDPTVEARSALLDASAVHTPTRLAGVEGNTIARVTSDGTLIAAAGSDGHVRLWAAGSNTAGSNTAAPRSLGEFVVPGGPLFAAAIDPTGKLMAVGGVSGASLWSLTGTPHRLSLLDANLHTTQDLAFSPDGKSLAAGTADETVLRWNVSDPAVPTTMNSLAQPGGAPGTTITYSPDGKYFASAGYGNALRVWDTARMGPADKPILDSPPDGTTYSYLRLAFSPDGRTLAAGTTGNEIRRWAVGGPAVLTTLPALGGFSSYVNDVTFTHDGTKIAAVSSDSSTKLWDAASGRLIETLPGSGTESSVQFGAQDATLVTAGSDGFTRVWALPGPVLTGQTGNIFQVPASADGRRVIAGVGSHGDGMRLWDFTTPLSPTVAPTHLQPVADKNTGGVAMTRDGSLVADGTASGGFELWDTRDAANPVPFGGITHAVDSLVAVIAFDTPGKLMAISGQNGNMIGLWSVADRTAPVQLSILQAQTYPAAMALSPDGHTLAVPTTGGVVEIWDVSDPTASKRNSIVGGFGSDAQAVAFSRDGRTMAVGSADRTVQLWDMSTPAHPALLSRIVGPSDAVYSLNFNKTGDALVAGTGQGVWLWDITDRTAPKTYATLTAYGTRVNDVSWGPSDSVLIAGGVAQNLRVWASTTAAAKTAICAHAGDEVTKAEWDQYLPGVPYREPCR